MDIVYVKNSFYQENENLKEVIFPKVNGNDRPYYFLSITYKNNNIFIPLRSVLNNPERGIGYSVPSSTRLDAGLDYRKIIIINDLKYIERKLDINIASSQKNLIQERMTTIESEVIGYIKGYERSYEKDRVQRDFKFKYSTLCNYHKELGLE